MTFLGKILAVVNLVLSLAVAAFIVSSFVARTKWHDAYEKTLKEFNTMQQNARAAQGEADQARAELEKCKTDTETAKAGAKTESDGLKATIKDLQEKVAAEEQKVQARINSLASQNAELASRQREAEYLKVLVAQRDETIKQKEQENEAAHNKATENEIARMSQDRRNQQLLAELERMTKEQKKTQNGGTAVAAATTARTKKNPPAEDIEGLVKATDPESGFITLTIGSDAGLSKGNTLEVFRLKPEPAYLGTVEILAVQHDQAVAKPIARVRGAIQVGDRVASSITNHR
jgi:septal ring factor EnvC (AmiA/AmiB activator)